MKNYQAVLFSKKQGKKQAFSVGTNYQNHRLLEKLLWCFLFLLISGVATAMAQNQVTDDDVNQIARGMYCPVCENEPLDTCGTQACIDWRQEIREQLEAGVKPAQVREDFRRRFGDKVLATPPARGINLVLWVGIPLGIVVAGAFFGRFLLKSQTEPKTIETAEQPVSADPYIQRIEEEIGR